MLMMVITLLLMWQWHLSWHECTRRASRNGMIDEWQMNVHSFPHSTRRAKRHEVSLCVGNKVIGIVDATIKRL